jgi:adenosylcobinamide kinase/adenosylcobinamide-phosphate guanylyltransferase
LKILVIGGSKSGKSLLAQALAQKLHSGRLFYIATMKPRDNEDLCRIKRHIAERDGCGFETIEQPEHINECIKQITAKDTILIDSLSTLLANEIFKANEINTDAYLNVSGQLKQLCDAVCNAVIVSDFIFSDATIFEHLTQSYLRGLSKINRNTAMNCDIVIEMNNSNCICHKGKDLYSAIFEKTI